MATSAITPVDTSSFTPTQLSAFNAANALGSGVPTVNNQKSSSPAVEPSVLSSTNIDDKNSANVQTATKAATTPVGQTVGAEGFIRNADASFAEAPSGATQVTDQGTGQNYWTYNGMSYALGPLGATNTESGPTYNGANGVLTYQQSGNPVPAPAGAVQSANGNWYVPGQESGQAYGAPPTSATGQVVSSDPATQGIYDQLTTLKGQMDATGAANVAAIQAQYKSLIDAQTQANAGSQANTYSLLARSGSLQTGSSSGIVNAQISYGLTKISDLVTAENAAVVAAQQAMQSGDYKILDEQLSIVSKAQSDRQAAAQKLQDTITTATAQARKDSAINSVIQTGVTDPSAILSALSAQGNDTISAKDVSDYIAAMNPDAKNITDLMKTAAGNGATGDILKAIGSAKNYTEALTAAGLYASGATGDLGLYQEYVREAQKAGQNPIPFESWQNQNEYNKAFAQAKGTAAGKATADAAAAGNAPVAANVKSKADLPKVVQPYAHQSANGSFYIDLSGLSPTLADQYAQEVGDVPIVRDKTEAEQLMNITATNKKLDTLAKIYSDISQPSALARDLGGAGLTYSESLLQTNPKLAADKATQVLKSSIFNAVGGIGTSGRTAKLAGLTEMPSIYSTQDDNATLINSYKQYLTDNENTILGTNNNPSDVIIRSEDQATNALIDAGKKDSAQQDKINQIANTINPDTGQKYTAVETAQILGIDIPELRQSNSPGSNLPPPSWWPFK